MAAIETNTKSSLHTRHSSWPAAPHPLVSQFEEHLQRLKNSEATSSLSSSSVSHKLDGLQDLQDCTDKLLHLQKEQQTLAQGCNEKRVDELLQGSLRLLEICSSAKDCLLQSKESMQELQSAIRRWRGNEAGFAAASAKYLNLRKTMKKAIRKTLENLKGMKKEYMPSSSNEDNSTFMLSFLKEAEEVTLSSLEQLLFFISKGNSKGSRWSVISKLVQPKRVAFDSQESENEFEKVDAALQCLINHKPSSLENFQSYMENLEMCIQDLEIGVGHLSRKLIRNRVSLLNIFNH